MPLTRRDLLGAVAVAPVLLRAGDASAQGMAPKRGGILHAMLTPEPPILIPGVNNQNPTLIAAGKIFQGLLAFSPRLEPLPSLAKSWDVGDDKLTYTFHLQEGVKWHDGRPFTAEDVVFSIMKFAMEVSPRARAILARMKDGAAPDPLTVRFTLDKPFEPFLLMFDASTLPMMPKHLYEGTDYRTNPANQHPVGTGPFKFTEWRRGNYIRLDRFGEYWKPDQPYLDAIVYQIVPDSQSRALALQTGQATLSESNDIEPFDVPRFRAQPNLEVETSGWEYFAPLLHMEINCRVAPLNDPRVRRALAHAIDRTFIAQHLWFGVGKPATGPFTASTRFYDASAQMPKYDPATAMAMLDAAGLKAGPGGTRFKMKHLVLPYGEVWTRLSEYLKQSLHKVGVELVLESTDAGSWASRMAAWDYETSINFLYQFGDPTLGVERLYVSSNIKHVTFTNTGGFSDPKVDDLFAAGRDGATAEARAKAFSEVQRVLIDQMPNVWLLDMTFPTIHQKTLRNVVRLGTGVNASFDDVFFA